MTDESKTQDIRIALVVAVARNGVIGEHGTLPWTLPSELRRFRAITLGHPCVMGRKTWESLKGPLKGRDTIVLTRKQPIARDGVLTVHSLEEALAAARQAAVARGVGEIMIIGGGELYRQTLPMADRLYLTRVDMDASGDTTFPAVEAEHWRQVAENHHQADPGDSCGYVMLILDRIRATSGR